ncbi:hypothetical protein MRX96_057415 [Rhipicephalus microplus]
MLALRDHQGAPPAGRLEAALSAGSQPFVASTSTKTSVTSPTSRPSPSTKSLPGRRSKHGARDGTLSRRRELGTLGDALPRSRVLYSHYARRPDCDA